MRLFLSCLIIFSSIFTLEAQILEPVKWSIEKEFLGNDEYNLIFTANIDEGWTVYSQYTSDDGPVPTSINFDNPEVVELIGDGTESGKKKSGFDKIFEVDVIKFLADEPFVITKKLKVKNYDEPLVGYLTFMTCDATKCLPPKDIDFEFTFAQESMVAKRKKSQAELDREAKKAEAAQKDDMSQNEIIESFEGSGEEEKDEPKFWIL